MIIDDEINKLRNFHIFVQLNFMCLIGTANATMLSFKISFKTALLKALKIKTTVKIYRSMVYT